MRACLIGFIVALTAWSGTPVWALQRTVIRIRTLPPASTVVQFKTCTATLSVGWSQANLNTAITNASNNGVICLPAGSTTLTNVSSVNSVATRTKGLTIQGAGIGTSASDPTATVITANNTANTASGECCPVFVMYQDDTLGGMEVSNIRFVQGTTWTNANEEAVWAILLGGHADSTGSLFRIHHCWFEQNLAPSLIGGGDIDGGIVNSIRVGGNNVKDATHETTHVYSWGVIDHNTWHGVRSFQTVDVLPYAGVGEGSVGGILAWQTPLSDHLNSFKCVFYENNSYLADVFGQSNAITDGQAGACYVFRYNTVKNNFLGGHGYEDDLGIKWIEVYQNDFCANESVQGYIPAASMRGGSEVFYSNRFWDARNTACPAGTITGSNNWSTFAEFQYYRGNFASHEARGPSGVCQFTCDDFGSPLGCDNHDILSGSKKGSICGGQPGSRKGASQPTWQWGYDWALEPLVAWANTLGASTPTTVWVNQNSDTLFVERTEYIDYNSCGAHMGETVCAAYWDNTNNKKLGYAAYAYPHERTMR